MFWRLAEAFIQRIKLSMECRGGPNVRRHFYRAILASLSFVPDKAIYVVYVTQDHAHDFFGNIRSVIVLDDT